MAGKTFDLRSWIREQSHVGYTADLTDDDHFVLETDYATAQVNFYDMSPEPEVVELHIEEKATGDAKFFLHFHATEREHATQSSTRWCRFCFRSRSSRPLKCCSAAR